MCECFCIGTLLFDVTTFGVCKPNTVNNGMEDLPTLVLSGLNGRKQNLT